MTDRHGLSKKSAILAKPIQKITNRLTFRGSKPLAAALFFAGVGTLLTLSLRAASPTAHFEAEGATLACATSGSDANASGGQFFKFSGTDCVGQAQTASSVTQYGITWTFSQPKQVGQFANGDWWVVGPVTINSITPAYNSTTQKHGWQVNPSNFDNHGYDGSADGFQASLVPALPYNAAAGQSIIKAVSILPDGNGKAFVQSAAVLT
ncbi:MAG: hypothetical protein ACRD4B_04480, partial [Acidobacteriota bacterium]